MSGSGAQLSEEEARKLLMSLDPRMLEQISQLQHQRLGAEQEHDDVGSGSGISGYLTQSSSGQLGLPGEDPAKIIPSSPTLKKVSVGSMDVKSGAGVFKKKKSIPSLVMTFNAANKFLTNNQEASENVHKDIGEEALNPAILNKSAQLLSVDSVMDRMETASVASFRSGVSKTMSQHSAPSYYGASEGVNKKQRFWDNLSMVCSITYGIGILMGALIAYCSDLIMVNAYKTEITEIFNLTLSIVGILLLGWLIFDIERYIRKLNKMSRKRNLGGAEFKLVEGPDGDFDIEIPMNNKEKKKLPEYYGFTTGRHSGSFFLKIGAAFFCFGHLIHMGLNFVKRLYMKEIENEIIRDYCVTNEKLAHDVIYSLFALVQLFFLFKYGNVIVNKNKALARFSFMHCASSSLSFWINTVLQETLDTLVKKYFTYSKIDGCGDNNNPILNNTTTTPFYTTTTDDDDFNTFAGPIKLPDCDFNGGVGDISNNVVCVVEIRAKCNLEISSTEELFTINPWFYPFSIEFSILIVAIWYILWSSIGNIDQHKNSLEFLPSSITPQGSTEDLSRTQGHKEAQIIFADCSSSNTGLFFGSAMTVVVIVVSIFVLVREGGCDTDKDLAITVGNVLQITINSILILVTLYTYYVVCQFDINPHPISFLDDLLLFFCIPSFFLYAYVCLGPSVFISFDPEFFFRNLLIIVQVLIQTPMIVDGLRRCSNSVHDQRLMKGRNAITFLIVGNLAVYIMETLLIRSYDYQSPKIDFYGPDVWTVLSHMTLPICIFYRFHSAVALVDIWTSAYKSEHAH